MKTISNEKILLFSYFIILILLGSIVLDLKVSWGSEHGIKYIDALFTSVSAVCVTGLITVNTSEFSEFGQIVIMLLIQFGGLGIITFTTLYIAIPRKKISLKNINIIKAYTINDVEYKSKNVVLNIVLMTLFFEIIGAFLLYNKFKYILYDKILFTSFFHSVSAFCNAGFSTFDSSLIEFNNNKTILFTIMFLIILGGIGFVVINDISKKITGKKKKISLHSKIVLLMSLILIISGTLLFFLFENRNELRPLSFSGRLINALFQSVTCRTAGFNSINEQLLMPGSKLVSLLLMLIGGAPGSIAGGIKVTTFFFVLFTVYRGVDYDGEIIIGKRKINRSTITHANIFTLKAVSILFISIIILSITERSIADKNIMPIVFEAFSAFGTVGLSLGITPKLSIAGKLVIIFTMFAGRVGLISMVIPMTSALEKSFIDYPEEEVLIG